MTVRVAGGCRLALTTALAAVVLVVPGRAEAQPLFGYTEPAQHNLLSSSKQDRLLDLEAMTGGRLHRVTLLWADVEPYLVNGTPVQNWSYYDRVFAAVAEAGMKPVITIIGAPRWAIDSGECRGAICPPARSRLAEWSRFAYDAAKRYPRAAAIEVWSEPNGRGQWTTNMGPDPERYAQLFSHAAGAIHYANPSVPVVVGGITYWLKDEPKLRMTIPTFMERFYRAGGGTQLRPGDGFGLHIYPWINELTTLKGPFATTLRQMRESLARFDPARKIWVTETGVTTSGPWAVSQRDQAKGALSVKRKLAAALDVRATLFHSTVEGPYDPNHTNDHGFGFLFRDNLAPKLAYCALAELGGAPRISGCPARVLSDLDLGGGGSGSASDPATASGKKRLRARARRHCRRKLRQRQWWPAATRTERRARIRICVRRYIAKRS